MLGLGGSTNEWTKLCVAFRCDSGCLILKEPGGLTAPVSVTSTGVPELVWHVLW